jgi:hypothetical protein
MTLADFCGLFQCLILAVAAGRVGLVLLGFVLKYRADRRRVVELEAEADALHSLRRGGLDERGA